MAQSHRGDAWLFALLLLAVGMGCEAAWLVFVTRSLRSGRNISREGWRFSIFVESLLPTAALFFQIHTSVAGPQRALTSPPALLYFFFIALSALHLDSGLSRLAGGCAAAGYVAASLYVFLQFPQAGNGYAWLVYAICFLYAALLLLGGFAAGAVADQIRLRVVEAPGDPASRARTARVEHDFEIACSIQQGLLPKAPPRIEGFDIAGWNQPADATGGDYFDCQQLEDGRLALTIADATGQGIGTTVCMAACRAYARAILPVEPDLRVALRQLNRLLYEDLPPEKFVTLAAGLLDPEDATLDLISAGHGPLLFYLSSENRFRSYDAQGLPLGLLPQAGYSCSQRLRFAPGDILALATDGFIEWANADGESFGQMRLKNVISAHHHQPAATIISELYSAVLNFAGSSPQHDDLTILIVKRTPAGDQRADSGRCTDIGEARESKSMHQVGESSYGGAFHPNDFISMSKGTANRHTVQ